MRVTPAQIVIDYYGSAGAVARALGVDRSAVSKWRAPKEKQGSEGYLPARVLRQLMLLAKEQGLPWTAEELILGREVEG